MSGSINILRLLRRSRLRRIYLMGIAYLIFTITSIQLVYSSPEVCGYIDEVVDGDTLWMSIDKVYIDRYMDFMDEAVKVRLADIDAPELSTPEGLASRDELLRLINEYGNYACLNVDDEYVYDVYGRVIEILYLSYNATHLLNVNQYLVENGYALYIDYQNEFGLDSFNIYISKNSELVQPSLPDIYIIMFIAIIVAIYLVKRRKILL
ncbi:MAG TPA: hypothetical protein EYH44_04520 [Thermoprotei archaeon]|nr:hypothetical protein [Thermoprotei archaeon]